MKENTNRIYLNQFDANLADSVETQNEINHYIEVTYLLKEQYIETELMEEFDYTIEQAKAIKDFDGSDKRALELHQEFLRLLISPLTIIRMERLI